MEVNYLVLKEDAPVFANEAHENEIDSSNHNLGI